MRAGEWSRNADWSFWKSPLMELAGKTMGIVGFGRIGRQTGRIADAMGMRVIANDTYQGDAPAWPGFRWAGLDELLRESDVVSLHSPLFPGYPRHDQRAHAGADEAVGVPDQHVARSAGGGSGPGRRAECRHDSPARAWMFSPRSRPRRTNPLLSRAIAW